MEAAAEAPLPAAIPAPHPGAWYLALVGVTVATNLGAHLLIGTDKWARLFGLFVLLPGANGVLMAAGLLALFLARARVPRDHLPGLVAVAVLGPPVLAFALTVLVGTLFPSTGSGC